MKDFLIQTNKKIKPKRSIAIIGLPGIGNVAKISVDYLIDKLDAKEIISITSKKFPHSIFVDQENLIELPKISIFYKKIGNLELLLIGGDNQPIDEQSCYEFCEKLIEILEKLNCKEVITLGGIGLNSIPKNPAVYCAGNNKRFINKFTKIKNVRKNLYEIVGPIVGVAGILIGVAKRKKIDGACLLAETYGSPMFLGFEASKKILNILNKEYKIKVNLKDLERDLKEEIDFLDLEKKKINKTGKKELNYIG